MKKTLIYSILALTFGSAVFAEQNIDFIVAGSTGGATNAQVQILAANFKSQGYDVNIIQGGNCKNGPALYAKTTTPTIMLLLSDYISTWEANNGQNVTCGTAPRDDFVMLSTQFYYLFCGLTERGSSLAKLSRETKEVTMASSIGIVADTSIKDLSRLTRVPIKQITYEGSGQAVKGVLSGEVDYGILYPSKAFDSIKSNKLSCFATNNNVESMGIPPLTSLFKGFKFNPGLNSFDVIFMKNVKDPAAIIRSLVIATNSPEWKNYQERSGSVIPALSGDNHKRIFNDTIDASKKMIKETIK